MTMHALPQQVGKPYACLMKRTLTTKEGRGGADGSGADAINMPAS